MGKNKKISTRPETIDKHCCQGKGKVQNDPQNISFPKVTPKETKWKPLVGEEIFTVENVLSIDECGKFIDFSESLGFQNQSSRGAAFQEAVRDNDRVQFESAALAEHLWKNTGLSKIFSKIQVQGMQSTGLNPNLRFYRYKKGQKFGRHVDESVTVDDAETKYTLLIYLCDSRLSSAKGSSQTLSGGETVFYGRKNRVLANVVPQAGMALLHIHGDYCHEHEGAQVRHGVKYVLRSDVLFKKIK